LQLEIAIILKISKDFSSERTFRIFAIEGMPFFIFVPIEGEFVPINSNNYQNSEFRIYKFMLRSHELSKNSEKIMKYFLKILLLIVKIQFIYIYQNNNCFKRTIKSVLYETIL
jgi:hypothetical protein